MLRLSTFACACAALCLLHAGAGQAWARTGGQAAQPLESDPLADYSLEQLSDIVVTSVSRQPGRLGSAPASLYVIGSADIARAGAATLPEALRLAPNLQVALASSQEYAISARGFSSQLANKLLVLVDGRSVYSPLFSGVFREAIDLPMHDVERIEVTSGPGGTIWGTNAVNGVINIITRSAADTQGGLAIVRAGNRYAGFRLDWQGVDQSLTVSGDMHRGALRASREARTDFSGANLSARLDAELAGGAQLRVQAYVEQTRRTQAGAGEHALDTADLEAQVGKQFGERHALTWGGGYRQGRDRFVNGPVLQFAPNRRRLAWTNLFAQDEFSITPQLRATAGLRLEQNDCSGLELLPSLRLAWDAAPGAMLWAAASRTVRAPARIDRDLLLIDPTSIGAPGGPRVLVAGSADFQSETARVAELGWRVQPTAALSYSATLFYSDYARLRTVELQGAGPALLGNLGVGQVRGLELWGSWQVLPCWRLMAGGVVQDIDTGAQAASTDASARTGLATNHPRGYLLVRSSHDLAPGVSADLMLRRVARLPQPAVPGYHELDARLACQARPGVGLSLTGRNLLHAYHPEFGAAGLRQLAERSVFASASLRF